MWITSSNQANEHTLSENWTPLVRQVQFCELRVGAKQIHILYILTYKHNQCKLGNKTLTLLAF